MCKLFWCTEMKCTGQIVFKLDQVRHYGSSLVHTLYRSWKENILVFFEEYAARQELGNPTANQLFLPMELHSVY